MTKFEKDRLHSIVECYIIDSVINDILENGKREYKELGYVGKTTICKLIKKKSKLFGRVIA